MTISSLRRVFAAVILTAIAPLTSAELLDATGDVIDGQYIVVLDKTIASDDQTAGRIASEYGAQLLHVYQHALNGFAIRLPALAAEALALDPRVRYVEPDHRIEAIATQANATWGLDRIDERDLPMDGDYDYPNSAGAGAHVYVIDTGIRETHQEFTGRVGTSRNFVSPVLFGSTDPNDYDDCNGHGTHVTGTAAGTTYGVAKQATVHGVRVLDCQGSGSGSDILAGIDWVTANHESPAVANMSLGTVGGRSQSQEDAVAEMVAAGVFAAVAAGNDNADACGTSPAAEPTAFTVGATEASDARASYSNYGTCLDLFAPGSNITSAWYQSDSDTNSISGTSMASPHVAGAAALVLGTDPGASVTDIEASLIADATADVVSNPRAGSPNLLLYVDTGDGGGSGPTDSAPTAAFTVSCTNLSCDVDASTSTDDHGVASYDWTFGDGTSGNGAVLTHDYASDGDYTITLTVTDTVGQTDSSSDTVSVAAAGGDDDAPCTDCTHYEGSLNNGQSAYYTSADGFSSAGGSFNGYLSGPASADFDLILQKYSCVFVCSWSNVASAETVSSEEEVHYNGTSGTYRWQVKSYSGSGAFDFWMDNP